jgi:hypothetical protein
MNWEIHRYPITYTLLLVGALVGYTSTAPGLNTQGPGMLMRHYYQFTDYCDTRSLGL